MKIMSGLRIGREKGDMIFRENWRLQECVPIVFKTLKKITMPDMTVQFNEAFLIALDHCLCHVWVGELYTPCPFCYIQTCTAPKLCSYAVVAKDLCLLT